MVFCVCAFLFILVFLFQFPFPFSFLYFVLISLFDRDMYSCDGVQLQKDRLRYLSSNFIIILQEGNIGSDTVSFFLHTRR